MGKPVRLRPWQKRELRKIYDNPAGTRMAIISFAKKNGKTSFAAFLLLPHLCGPEHRPNTQLPSTAQSKDQASILFNLAAKVVRQSPTLYPVVTIRDTIKQLVCEELGTVYKALSAEVATAHGQSPVFAVHDETRPGPGACLRHRASTALCYCFRCCCCLIASIIFLSRVR